MRPHDPTARVRPAMADIQPLRALHYDQSLVGPLADVTAPPYDVIDPAAARSAAPALPLQRCRRRPAQERPRSLRGSRRALGGLAAPGCHRPRPRARHLGPHPDLHRPRRPDAHPQRLLLPGADRGLWTGTGTPARAHAPGPEGGSPAPDEDDPREPLPHLLPLLRPRERRLEGPGSRRPRTPPGARSPTPTAPSTALARDRLRRRSPPCRQATSDAELLIADGHHRYETARDLRRGARRRGRAPLHAHVPGRARGPGPHRLPHPPPRARPRSRAPRGLERNIASRLRDRGGAARSARARARQRARCSSATSTPTTSSHTA